MRKLLSGSVGPAAMIAGLLTASIAATAETPALHPDDDCLTCHADESLTGAGDRSVHVDAAKLGASVHGQMGLACVDCHADVATVELPHEDNLAAPDCASCHDSVVEQYRGSVHGQAREAGRNVGATCVDCHGSHDIRSAKDPDSRTYHLSLPKTCGQCHGSDARIAAAHMPGGNVVRQFEDSIHGQALIKSGLLVAPNCASCHGAHEIAHKSDPTSRVSRQQIPDTCGSCHGGIRRSFERGRHGDLQQQEESRGPVCIDCHTAHGIQRADLPGWQADIIDECGTCHVESIASYRDTFHGQVTALGFTRVATCASCHGAHEVLPASDPKSPVHATNRVETCRKCHPGANVNFAGYDPHANRHQRDRSPLLYYTGRFMEFLLAGVFGFFGLHTGLWFTKEWRVRRQRRRVPEKDVRR